MATPAPHPAAGIYFRVEIDGLVVTGFTEVTGLDTESEVIDYRTGESGRVRRLAGMSTSSHISMTRAVDDNLDLWQWRKLVLDGDPAARRDGIVDLLAADGAAIARLGFVRGWPMRYTVRLPDAGAAHAGTADDVALETVTIAHEGFERIV